MTMWTPDIQLRSGPRYLAIAEALAEDTGGGRLRPGTRLPTHRDLADRLGVTVGTVTRAYAEATRRGLVSGEVGRGTFVRAAARPPALPAHAADTTLVDLSANLPPGSAAPAEAATLARTLSALARRKDLGRLLAYPPEGGALEHRAAGAEWVRRAGFAVTADRVLVTSGSQHGMTAVFASLFAGGDVVATESLTYPGMKTLAGLLALRLHGVAMDEHGLRPDALRAACRSRRPKALYCVPTLQNPTTAVMPVERRQEIAAIAREYGVLIVEDDVHGRLLARPVRPLSTFAPDISVYVTGTAKVLAPGLRVGFIVAPAALGPRIAAGIRGTTWMAAPLMAEIASRWIEDGTAESILARKRKDAGARYRVARRALDRFAMQAHPDAYHLWLSVPRPWRADGYADAARRAGVAVTPASAFAVGRGATPEAVRLCLGAAADKEVLARALGILTGLLTTTPEAPESFGP
jgi:DNA-binding transcriptional MocR family regulator